MTEAMLEFDLTPEAALKAAVTECGTEAELARRLNVTAQAVNQWRVAPPMRVLDIERATEGQITRHQLRPDLYPADRESSSRHGVVA